MKYALLYDTNCPACTRVAKRLRELNVRDLQVKSLADPDVVAKFGNAGRLVPTRPALIRVDGESLRVWTGFGMRLKLARLLGFGRAGEILELASLEAEARASRRTGMSRRKLLGRTAIGIGAVVFGSGTVPANADKPARSSAPLGDDAKQRVLSSPAIQESVRVWGELDDSSFTGTESAGVATALVRHRDTNAFTIVDAHGGNLGMTFVFTEEHTIRYYLPSGHPLGEQVVDSGELRMRELTTPAPNAVEPTPQGKEAFIRCWLRCMGFEGIAECFEDCIGCVESPSWPGCTSCALCVGPRGYKCVWECKDQL